VPLSPILTGIFVFAEYLTYHVNLDKRLVTVLHVFLYIHVCVCSGSSINAGNDDHVNTTRSVHQVLLT